MTLPLITAMTASVLALMQAFLMVTVGNRRRAKAISFGDGGDGDMLRLMRRHGNFTENAPMVLILLALMEMLGAPSAGVMTIAVMFVLTRICHAIALSADGLPLVFRVLGALGTLLSLVGGAGLLAYQASGLL